MAIQGFKVDPEKWASNPVKIDVIRPSDKSIERALTILDWYLADHPEKTIVVKQTWNMRVCLIAEKGQGEKCVSIPSEKET